jgi:hypothetical protein
MISFLGLLLHVLALPFRSRASLEAEIVFLRHQLNVLKRQAPARPRLSTADRWLFFRLYRWMPSLLNAAVIVRPDTIVRWHRMGFQRTGQAKTHPRSRWRSVSRIITQPAA